MTNANTGGTAAPIINSDGSLSGTGKALAGKAGVILAGILSEAVVLLEQNFGVALGPQWNIGVQTLIGLVAVGYGVYQAHPDWHPWFAGLLGRVRHFGKVAMPIGVLVIGASLAGCGLLPAAPTPPATPAPADVGTETAALATVSTVPPAIYLMTGVTVANRWCVVYLNALASNENQAQFEASSATTLGGLGTGIAAAIPGGQLPAAIIGMIAPAINQELLQQAQAATAGMDPGVVAQLIAKEQSAFLGALPAAGPASDAEADLDVTTYGGYCQPAGIRAAVLQAGLAATASAAAPAASLTLAAPGVPVAPAPRAITAPPLVTVH